MEYRFSEVEAKWRKKWAEGNIFDVDVNQLASDKFYILTMFPYPSGDRLHMGHWYQYGLMDSWARFQRLRGKKVFQPMGFDAFGLPAENFAIKKGIHPDVSTTKNVEIMKQQFERMGVSYPWRYELNTSKPNYYKWTQWVFSELYKNGLAYKKEAPVNWCPSCQTVLANEQVKEGLCERCDSSVERKNLSQWFFKITQYADRLLNNIEGLDWPAKTKSMQKHWIGKSVGAEIHFSLEKQNKAFTVFTTRPDTLMGVTYVVLAPEHSLVREITVENKKAEVEDYIHKSSLVSELDRIAGNKEKSGVFTGAFAFHPVTNEKLPIWISDYVVSTYGTGAVMAVPCHDERDEEFAKKFSLPFKKVIDDSGTLIDSGPFNGLSSDAGQEKIVAHLETQKKAQKKVNFRLRDWLISRQRYWGSPIPIINCVKCGEVLVPENQLPVVLPDDVDFKPTGESPLKRCASFYNVDCPKCHGPAHREVDTMDTFVCSSWYFLRYPNVGNDKQAFDPALTNKICPVDKYVGGPEHACMHLLYARFMTMVMKDLGYVNFEEPFPSLTHQGLVLGPDGLKMSKSKGNTVSPDPYVDEHGSDVLRLYLAFGFSYIEGGPWSDGGFKAASRFGQRLLNIFSENIKYVKESGKESAINAAEKKLLYSFHNTIKMATFDIDRFQFNTAIARYMELYNCLNDYFREVPEEQRNTKILHDIFKDFLILLSPFMPHFCEEWWEISGEKQSIFKVKWPHHDEKFLVMDVITIAVMINGKVRGEIEVSNTAKEDEVFATAQKSDKVSKYLENVQIVKKIFVPGKLLNLVVK